MQSSSTVISSLSFATRGGGKHHMVFNWMEWKRDGKDIPKIHPTQKPQSILRKLIETFTDPGDIVIDPVAGSGATLRAAHDLGRTAYGFEISKKFYRDALDKMLNFDEQENGKQLSLFDMQMQSE